MQLGVLLSKKGEKVLPRIQPLAKGSSSISEKGENHQLACLDVDLECVK